MSAERILTLRVLSALLREDLLGLRTLSVPVRRTDGSWLRLDRDGSSTLLLPVAEDGFQCEYAARLPLLEVDGVQLETLDGVLAALRELAEPEDRGGHDAFAEECRQTLATMELHDKVRPEVLAALAARYGGDPAQWSGLGASLAQDTLAAYLDHPVYPTARGRADLTEDQLSAYAPEFHPSFLLRWFAVPVGTFDLHTEEPLPDWWPTPEAIGLPELAEGHLTVPVHPLTAGAPLTDALREAGLEGVAVPGPTPYLEVVPTLSMRTVAVARDPRCHLKLPLATATLGMRNRRTIKAGVLPDGAAGQRLLETVIGLEPRFTATILHADEQSYGEGGHELLAVLLRRYPEGMEDAVTVPLASLAATAPGGRLVVDHLADRFYDGDHLALYDAFLTLLLDWQTTLFRYGIALESHQQNTSLVFDRADGATRLRLLYKDNDGLRINGSRLNAALGEFAPAPKEFDDARIFADSDRPLTDLFTTITGHLCAASLAFALSAQDRIPLETSLGLLRERLSQAVDRLRGDGAALRADLLDADRLPVKAMVTAGTLLSKQRSGAADINKHYTSGPNYLRPAKVAR
ncbi:IucA/IucC family protein [Streptomyces sp. ISL-66]|uniref:IucA/IucC family protein n=1 Tax=Streptomyces sp. ISL-66 TaxID=2819186 RepID=UPI0027E3F600|nr:IucA/IucC family protein [Streptomyces sp. ISL-66]